ncbi:YbhB/YbcL family Raf kinase inhibitor-like protein [Paenibacillus rigui]|nr:YbhB/YbcL family Raf kinase inhibitor-like protein [Paenibacillus rigui]
MEMKRIVGRKVWIQMALWGALCGLSVVPGYAAAEEAGAVQAPAAKDVVRNVSSYLQWNTPVNLQLEDKALPVQGAMINTVIMVPLRSVAEASGARLTWDEATRSVRIEGSQLSAVQKLGEKSVTVNGTSYELDHESMLSDGNLLVPARLLPLVLGLELRWDSASRTLALSSRHGSGGLTIRTEAFQLNGNIPVAYAHGGVPGGQNVSLPVSWSNAPAGTQSFAVVMYDIHPIADNYIHWSVIDLPADMQGLKEGEAGSLKAGRELNSYFGMEPPRYSGDHLYRVAVYALDTKKLDAAETPVFFEQLEPLLKEHMLGYAEVDGFFKQ